MEEAHIVVDLEAFPSESMHFTIKKKTQKVVDLEDSLQRELDTLWGNANEADNFTIFRTPHNISQSRKNLFEPSVISIGPFHHGKKHLQALEEQKRRFLRDFLSRGDHISLDLCISEMKKLETRTRRCYSETFDDLDSNAFVKMMLLDGCFVLEYFLKRHQGNYIREVGWNRSFIVGDLLLLENQIPFFIVEKLYEIGNLNQVVHRMFFVKFIASIFRIYLPTLDILPDPPAEIHHLIHLCYHYLVPNLEKPVVLSSKLFDLTRMFSANRIINRLLQRFGSRPLLNSTGDISSMVMPSATELKRRGLKFKAKNNPSHMLDISFEYGVIIIPRLQFTDPIKPIFANLIAFEHSKYGKGKSPFVSFVYFLDNLVNTPNDVTILQECEIIENWLGSEEELAHFINQVTEGNVTHEDHYLVELFKEVNKYSKRSWNRHRAKLIGDYFSSPWTAISLVAAFILLGLTCLQSFYAVYAYKFPPSP